AAQADEEPDDDVLRRAASAPNFDSLRRGEWVGLEYPSQSEADLAYIGILWDACGNAGQVERLWRASELASRAKGQRADYIAPMLANVAETPPRMLHEDGPASLFSDTANAHRLVHNY